MFGRTTQLRERSHGKEKEEEGNSEREGTNPATDLPDDSPTNRSEPE